MASQSNFRAVGYDEACFKMSATRDQLLRLDEDLQGCSIAQGLVNFDLLRKCVGMLANATFYINSIEKNEQTYSDNNECR